MMNEPSPWEIWHARFNFEGKKGYKYRPVVILNTNPKGLIVMMVTSATNKLALEHDYQIKDWQTAGLDKPSIARVDRIIEIPPDYLGSAQRIGSLSARDASSLSNILQQITSGAN